MGTRMEQRRGTTAEWTAANPILADGELGYDKTTKSFRIGDGVTAWADLTSTFVRKADQDATYISKAIVNAKGDLILATADDVVGRVAVGANGYILVADSTAAAGVSWVPNPVAYLVDAKGDLLVATGDNALARVAIGADGAVLKADSSKPTGVVWAAESARKWTKNFLMMGA